MEADMKLKHFITEQCDSVLYIGWNSPGNANTLDAEVIKEFLAIQRQIAASPLVGSILFSLKKDMGLGANIPLIYGAQKEEVVRELLTELHEMFFEIKKLAAKKPCVMVIDGLCLGGVYELALLFPWLVATDDPRTAIGVPEGKLGLIQGLGFLKRAVPRIGLINTIFLATTGKSIYARPAEKMGLVDEVVANIRSDERRMESVAEENVIRIAKNRVLEISTGKKLRNQVTFGEKVLRKLQCLPLVRSLILWGAREGVFIATGGHYPAPLAMIDVIAKGFSQPEKKACLEVEVPVFTKLAVSPLAKRLMRIFFAKENAKKMKLDGGIKFNPAQDSMAVIGGGFMGGQIALLLAKKGFWVSLVDVNQEVLAKTMSEIAKKIAADKSLKPHQKVALTAQIRPTDSYSSLSGVKCFIDATTENLNVKKKVLWRCRSAAPEAFVFFNTSTIPIHVITEDCAHPEKVALLHFFSPVDKMEPVEICAGADASPETFATAYELSKTLGKIPFVVGDNFGFVVNRVLMAGLQGALTLLLNGYRIKDIDYAMKKYGFALDSGHPMGPFELADFVGIKTASHVGGFLKNLPNFKKFPNVLEKMAEKNLTFWIKKEGKFFENKAVYDLIREEHGWWNDVYPKLPNSKIVTLILSAMRKEALSCVNEGVIGDEKTLDLLMFLSTGIPPAFRGGLLEEMRREDVAELVDALKHKPKKEFVF
jgi:3-hydroxyacyl-CoA dehydrogenase/enoyl-CoA hydratase/carnithine racemase